MVVWQHDVVIERNFRFNTHTWGLYHCAILLTMQKSFLQGRYWAEFQKALGREVVFNSRYLAVIEEGRLGSRLYLPYGPYVESVQEFREVLQELIEVAREKRVDFIRLEPTGEIKERDLEGLSLKRSRVHLQPMNTFVSYVGKKGLKIGVKAVREERRYLRRLAVADKKIKYSVSYDPGDIKIFLKQIREVAARTGMRPHPDKYFVKMAGALFPLKQAGLLIAKIDESPAATVIFYIDKYTMTYAHAASSAKYREFSPMTGLAKYAMEFAHQKRLEWFDWYGVAPEGAGPESRWHGLTQFKMSYGGERVKYAGIWELPVNKAKYFLVSVIYTIQALLDKALGK